MLRPGITFTNSGATIRVWAPQAKEVQLKCLTNEGNQIFSLTKEGEYHLAHNLPVKPGNSYWLSLNGKDYPDPASLFQPEGVHGPSQTVNLAGFTWDDVAWQTPKLEDFIIYELHTGTFSAEGNFNGIINKLDHLQQLGITAIELMPVAAFPGERNWGYDGVFPYAVQNSYGGPLALQQLVNQCHRKGIAVILDVVYNHFGPEGNIFPAFAPYLTQKHHTPWGPAINFDDAYADGVREYFIQNALMWFADFHVDALRLDAVHAIKDDSAQHILAALREEVNSFNQKNGRNCKLIVECDLNDRRFLDPLSLHGFAMDATWVDEFHHALRVAVGEEQIGYYSDFNGLPDLALAYQNAYVYNGRYSQHRKRTFGSKTTGLAGQNFVAFSQNHDQIGNRMLGERSSVLYGLAVQRLMAVALMLSPYIPLLFMGEEYGETQPFQYFVSHTDEQLIEAVRKGRRKEFKDFDKGGELHDPQAESTFMRSKLNWECLAQPPHQQMLRFYKDLIALRKSNPVLKKTDRNFVKAKVFQEKEMLCLHRKVAKHEIKCWLNFSETEQAIPQFDEQQAWELLLDSASENYGGKPSSKTNYIAGHSAKVYYRK